MALKIPKEAVRTGLIKFMEPIREEMKKKIEEIAKSPISTAAEVAKSIQKEEPADKDDEEKESKEKEEPDNEDAENPTDKAVKDIIDNLTSEQKEEYEEQMKNAQINAAEKFASDKDAAELLKAQYELSLIHI